MAVKITGLNETMAALNKEIRAIEGRTREGLEAAANFVMSESVPMAPIQTGNLRGSADVDVTPPGERATARVLYTAEYAAYVHEMRKGRSGRRRKKQTERQRRAKGDPRTSPPWAPGTGPKFLERAVRDNHGEILAIIRARAEIPGGGGA